MVTLYSDTKVQKGTRCLNHFKISLPRTNVLLSEPLDFLGPNPLRKILRKLL